MNKYIITFKDEVSPELLEKYNCTDIETMKHMKRICLCNMDDTNADKLIKENDIVSVEVDGADTTDGTNLSSTTTTYAFDMMNIRKFHDEGITGKGFKVGVLDTGIQKHENLDISGGYNAYDSSIPYDANLVSSHGTRVAGIIASKGRNNKVLGVAPDVDLYAIRIDDGTGGINRTLWSAQIKGINWAIENKMDAINCSFSSAIESQSRREAFEAAYNNGIAIFCSAGNTQPVDDQETYNVVFPSKYPFVVTCANIMSNKEKNPNSSVGRNINFANGGTSILSTTINKNLDISDAYNSGSGTSYATPATLGIYILYKQKYGESREKILQRMAVNAEYLGDVKKYGVGLPKYPTFNYENIQIRG
ncbi:S8 family serine peptidase [Mammaliicoccus sciuri]|uniref:S8 family serine peptidase n=1 Tax=Mammaliicoccus sciuri TaxID=1296 RepID=UPI001C629218|nr:S8 family serine peptidase [Mammaliicoccus sciuri]QYG29975.1 S8 family serine peptidase [Mammaliicoccus sciuri]